MKHIEPTTAYSDVARRVTERAQRMMEPRRVIIPVAGEPDPNRLAYSNKIMAEIEAKREAMGIANNAKALKRGGNNGHYYRPAPGVTTVKVSGNVVRALVEEGELAWVNECHSAVKVPDKPTDADKDRWAQDDAEDGDIDRHNRIRDAFSTR